MVAGSAAGAESGTVTDAAGAGAAAGPGAGTALAAAVCAKSSERSRVTSALAPSSDRSSALHFLLELGNLRGARIGPILGLAEHRFALAERLYRSIAIQYRREIRVKGAPSYDLGNAAMRRGPAPADRHQ